jgi:hypothetical protein
VPHPALFYTWRISGWKKPDARANGSRIVIRALIFELKNEDGRGTVMFQAKGPTIALGQTCINLYFVIGAEEGT